MFVSEKILFFVIFGGFSPNRPLCIGSKKLIFNDSIVGLIYVMTVVFGVSISGFIISIIMNFMQSLQVMGVGELEIEKIRHQEILEISAGRLILAAYRRYAAVDKIV